MSNYILMLIRLMTAHQQQYVIFMSCAQCVGSVIFTAPMFVPDSLTMFNAQCDYSFKYVYSVSSCISVPQTG